MTIHIEKPALTKIVATLGPATDSVETLQKLVAHGVSVFRLNFSHGDLHAHRERLLLVRQASQEMGRPLAILGDLCGPKIRVGKVPQGGILVEAGQDVLVRMDVEMAEDGKSPVLPCSYEPLAREVVAGQRVLIDDGNIRMLAVEALPHENELRCRVVTGGRVTTGKGLNLPDSSLSAPAITEWDKECMVWAVEHGADFLALSFVRRAEDVLELKRLLGALARGLTPMPDGVVPPAPSGAIPVIAKIEKPQAVEHIDGILEAADGIMVARGDLGVELDVAHVPIVQKRLIARAKDFGKPVIVATQMLESMIERASPTRAEASDVANAILDGADAVMLSGETAVGKFPVYAVETMRRIALATEDEERRAKRTDSPPRILQEARDRTAALAHGAWHIVEDIGASLVVVWSEGGGSARKLSQNDFHVPIIAFSSDETAVRRMALLRGVSPILWTRIPEHRSEFAAMVDRYALEHHWARPGDWMVLIAGKPLGVRGVVNTVAIRRAGELVSGSDE